MSLVADGNAYSDKAVASSTSTNGAVLATEVRSDWGMATEELATEELVIEESSPVADPASDRAVRFEFGGDGIVESGKE